MRRQGWLTLSLIGLLMFGWGHAAVSAEPTATAPVSKETKASSGDLIELPSSGNVTPEMWFYLQEYNRHKDPKEAVRRKAEARGIQRQNRLASQRWFGISNMRPMANPVPYYASYSNTWVGNSWNPYQWVGSGSGAYGYYGSRWDR